MRPTYARQLKALQEISRTIVSDLYLDDILPRPLFYLLNYGSRAERRSGQ